MKGEKIKQFKKASFAVLVAAGIALSGVFVACEQESKPEATSSATQSPQTVQTASSTQPVESDSQTETEQTRSLYYGLPYALFYNPGYRALTETENQYLSNFMALMAEKDKAANVLNVGSSEQITHGRYVFYADVIETERGPAHKFLWTTWDNLGPFTFYLSDEIYQNIELVLKRSAKTTKTSSGIAYDYQYGKLFGGQPYDEFEVQALKGALLDNCLNGYYKKEFQETFENFSLDYALETDSLSR